jgi:phosphoribosylanthranilate isomerase
MDDLNVRVKICGITRSDDAAAAVQAGAHALGFVFYGRSPRYLTPERAGEIIKALPAFVQTVGLFVNTSSEEVQRAATVSGIQAIQLHGDYTPEDCSGYSRPVIKVFRVKDAAVLSLLREYRTAGMLIDAAVPGKWGGTGQILDWHSVATFLDNCKEDLRKRLILAGGLNPENVGSAVRLVRPYAVDVSSGVEDEPGIKSHKKIKEFMYAVHNATRTNAAA